MRLLVLGGTIFLGKHFVAQALDAGHEVTMFNRGQHGAGLFPEVERIAGDRAGGLEPLAEAVAGGRRWDAVLDTCGYLPAVVRASAELLEPAVDRYCFISSISVYSDLSVPGATEEAPVEILEDPTTTDIEKAYGGLKALCEQVVTEVYGDRALNLRPGLIVGPDDPSARFAYWAVRLARGGKVLAPNPPDGPVQVIDVRDLAAFTLACMVAGQRGVIHVTGEEAAFSEVVAGADVAWVDPDVLVEAGVQPWVGLPLWIPAGAGMDGFMRVDIGRARAAGLVCRPLAETLADTAAWAAEHPDVALPAGNPTLTPEREAELLQG